MLGTRIAVLIGHDWGAETATGIPADGAYQVGALAADAVALHDVLGGSAAPAQDERLHACASLGWT